MHVFSVMYEMRERMERVVARQDHNKQSQNQEKLYKGHSGPVHHVVAKGEFLYTSSADHSIRRYHIQVYFQY